MGAFDDPDQVVMPFGKHQGKKLLDLLDEDPRYLDWLRGIEIRHFAFKEAFRRFDARHRDEIDRAVED